MTKTLTAIVLFPAQLIVFLLLLLTAIIWVPVALWMLRDSWRSYSAPDPLEPDYTDHLEGRMKVDHIGTYRTAG